MNYDRYDRSFCFYSSVSLGVLLGLEQLNMVDLATRCVRRKGMVPSLEVCFSWSNVDARRCTCVQRLAMSRLSLKECERLEESSKINR